MPDKALVQQEMTMDAATDPLLSESADTLSWHRFYARCRSEMEFRYGVRRIPRDRWKEQYALGSTVQQAARAIYQRLQVGDGEPR